MFFQVKLFNFQFFRWSFSQIWVSSYAFQLLTECKVYKVILYIKELEDFTLHGSFQFARNFFAM